ncbi:MAG: WG repeat-containing protein, partial [Bacteroidota bacterium]
QILVGYDHIRFLAGGFTITKNGKTGFADRTGRIVVPVLYDKVFLNDKNLFEVERDKKKYYVDSNGNEYIRE